MKFLRSFLTLNVGAFGCALVAQTPTARTEIPDAAQPRLTVSSDGRVWLAYGRGTVPSADHHGDGQHHKRPHDPGQHGKPDQRPDRAGELFVMSSDDGGATFAPAIKVARIPNLMLGMRRGPRIAVHGDQLTVTVVANELLALTSSDGGKTWSEPVTINEVPTSAREGLHDLAGSTDGQLFVTWLDLRNGRTELWGASSADGGRTWGKNERIYSSPDKSICECCHPSAIFDVEGNLAVMWRNSIGGSRDMWMTTRPKGAKQFTTARKLGKGTWKLNACPMDGGALVAFGGGKFGAVWQRAGEVFLTRGDSDDEMLVGKGRQPVGAARGTEPLVLWQQGTDLLVSAKPGKVGPTKHAELVRFPALVALPDGNGAVLAYEQGAAKEKQTRIVIERL